LNKMSRSPVFDSSASSAGVKSKTIRTLRLV
jgi:hypothetical protein